jgi:hypothetical protein
MSHIDLSWPPLLTAALFSAFLQPLFLFVLARLPGLVGHNAAQFVISAVLVLITFGASVIVSMPQPGAVFFPQLAIGLMALACGLILGLQAWGLLSRGYTIAILLTLLEASRPLTERDIINRYRKGEGLEWIMRHRMSGLVAAGLVTRNENNLALTPILGKFVSRFTRMMVIVLGLRRTG